MGDIIQITERRPKLVGEAICLTCKHKWEIEKPIGTVWFECPNCLCNRGMFNYSCEREMDHWMCNCKNKLFYVVAHGIYCPMCGAWQKGF